ncbi:MAG: DedA family protein [Sulfolobaceae archaeon]|nr:DedA family protein [Sulfolobales archaeon]
MFSFLSYSPNYLDLFLLMTLEGLGGPIPSEALMPLVGVWAYEGKIDLLLGVLVGTFGSLTGSLIAYFLGYYLGYEALKKYGKWVGISEREIQAVHGWFSRWGALAVFAFRFVPVVRALISYPAGVGRMNLILFIILTFVGHTIWDLALAQLGYVYGNQVLTWLEADTRYLYVITAALLAYFVYKVVKVVRSVRKGSETRSLD